MISCKDWNIQEIIDAHSNFKAIPRIRWDSPDLHSRVEDFDRDEDCTPLIIEGYHKHPNWPKDLFNTDSFVKNSSEDISVRDVHSRRDRTMPLRDFLTQAYSAGPHAKPDESERLYGKDAPCPQPWNDWLHDRDFLPQHLLPGNDSNLLNNLPDDATVETLMCYLGVGDTYTPCHKDLCGSSGQNLMCVTNNGSSFWFMTKGSDTPEVAQFFRDMKQTLDHETRVLSIDEFSKAPFTVYVTEQKLGDLVLVPPRSCHQVVNSGGLTIKTSWSRMTIKGLQIAYFHELPLYRRVCRVETYRVKNIILYTLIQKAISLRGIVNTIAASSSKKKRSRSSKPAALPSRDFGDSIAKDLKPLIELFACVLQEENCHRSIRASNSSGPSSLPHLDPRRYKTTEGYLTCDFCAADIFQTFFECENCSPDPLGPGTADQTSFVVCAGCYVENRSCECGELKLRQLFPFAHLEEDLKAAITIMKDYARESRGTPFDFQYVKRPGVSYAAQYLYANRQGQESANRRCRFSSSAPSHASPSGTTLGCRPCHSAKCFHHLLTLQRLHSAAAFVALRQDNPEKHVRYHSLHTRSSKQYLLAEPGLINAEKYGTRVDVFHQLTRLALSHDVCRPLNSSISLGWYDRHADLPLEDPTPGVDSSQPMPSNHDLGSESDLPLLTPSPSTTPILARTPSPKISSTRSKTIHLEHLKQQLIGVVVPSIGPSCLIDGVRVARRSRRSFVPSMQAEHPKPSSPVESCRSNKSCHQTEAFPQQMVDAYNQLYNDAPESSSETPEPPPKRKKKAKSPVRSSRPLRRAPTPGPSKPRTPAALIKAPRSNVASGSDGSTQKHRRSEGISAHDTSVTATLDVTMQEPGKPRAIEPSVAAKFNSTAQEPRKHRAIVAHESSAGVRSDSAAREARKPRVIVSDETSVTVTSDSTAQETRKPQTTTVVNEASAPSRPDTTIQEPRRHQSIVSSGPDGTTQEASRPQAIAALAIMEPEDPVAIVPIMNADPNEPLPDAPNELLWPPSPTISPALSASRTPDPDALQTTTDTLMALVNHLGSSEATERSLLFEAVGLVMHLASRLKPPDPTTSKVSQTSSQAPSQIPPVVENKPYPDLPASNPFGLQPMPSQHYIHQYTKHIESTIVQPIPSNTHAPGVFLPPTLLSPDHRQQHGPNRSARQRLRRGRGRPELVNATSSHSRTPSASESHEHPRRSVAHITYAGRGGRTDRGRGYDTRRDRSTQPSPSGAPRGPILDDEP